MKVSCLTVPAQENLAKYKLGVVLESGFTETPSFTAYINIETYFYTYAWFPRLGGSDGCFITHL
ncbi:hypothetical protein C1752_07893 [Acaryochloris thomasi RCC1774]|uniref:Uncharacterized protein n=1 Tax=Acaryochloris thomasi RCC1774 TaxID=1764569 RepID=A0A2W1JHX0_9CYAN|nr:hypothetical protein C1752_07893 [Acaryochloris thomasi RCC1774]